MSEQRLIDANAIEKRIYDSGLWTDAKAAMCKWIDSAPTVPAVVLPCIREQKGVDIRGIPFTIYQTLEWDEETGFLVGSYCTRDEAEAALRRATENNG